MVAEKYWRSAIRSIFFIHSRKFWLSGASIPKHQKSDIPPLPYSPRATAGPEKSFSGDPITTSFRSRRDRDAEGVEWDGIWGTGFPHHQTTGVWER